MASKLRSLSIGFKGGQVVAVRVESDQVDALQKALGTAGWHTLQTDDGPMRLDLGQVAYVRSDDGEHRVGFRA
ncbi:MAG TPA: hypothetical protein VGF95_10015 [Solirubrobacteraceae bacterium]|jgi:hypothetical protein